MGPAGRRRDEEPQQRYKAGGKSLTFGWSHSRGPQESSAQLFSVKQDKKKKIGAVFSAVGSIRRASLPSPDTVHRPRERH